MYMGLPQRTKLEKVGLLFFIPFNQVNKLLNKFGQDSFINKLYAYPYDIAQIIRWLSIAYSRMRKYKTAIRLAKQGAVIVFDRFSVNELNAYMKPTVTEGPRLKDEIRNKKWFLTRWFIEAEKRIYNEFAHNPYVTTFILDVNAETSAKRGRKYDVVARQSKFFKKIDPNLFRRIKIDANKAHKQTLAEIKKKMWARL